MKAKPLHLKKIDVKERIFYYFKMDATTHILYDSDMGEPVAYGSFNIVGTVIQNLPASSTIYYFEEDKGQGWKMKRSYKPEGKTATQEEKTALKERKDAQERS